MTNLSHVEKVWKKKKVVILIIMYESVIPVLQNCLAAFDVGLTCLASICSSFSNYI